MLHRFEKPIDGIAIPSQFTWPFQYSPHPLCRTASIQVQQHIATIAGQYADLKAGKMFGVLVVRDNAGTLGFITAFSGNIDGKNNLDYFVPPIYDALQPGDFFKTEEAEITKINRQIENLQASERLKQALLNFDETKKKAETDIKSMKEEMARRKLRRDILRAKGENSQALISESQRDKADLTRSKKRYKAVIAEIQTEIDRFTGKIEKLKAERKTRSAELQMKLFRQYRLLNARGEIRDICDIFANTPQHIPPAGAGECAAPKMLQYAYMNSLYPIAMAEFWWGDSPKGEIRRHGEFYPSCISKCRPILLYMMQGLNAEPDPQLSSKEFTPEIIWEDEHIAIIDKPAGMLSVEGKSNTISAIQWIRNRCPDAIAVHRLDQATSGILVIAKDMATYRALQAQFASRRVKKSYVALLDGKLPTPSGEIKLSLKPDYNHRPRQMAADDGKHALTRYEVIEATNKWTKIRFFPITGRTHQLRVHAAHHLGLNAPIVGDELYGTRAERLYLHAESIEFTHPSTGKTILINRAANFKSPQ